MKWLGAFRKHGGADEVCGVTLARQHGGAGRDRDAVGSKSPQRRSAS